MLRKTERSKHGNDESASSNAALSKLRRDDYLKLLTEQSRRIDALEEENARLKEQLAQAEQKLTQALTFKQAADRFDKAVAELRAATQSQPQSAIVPRSSSRILSLGGKHRKK